MISSVRSFVELAQNESSIVAVLRAGEYVLPSPHKEKFAFTKSFLKQLPDDSSTWRCRLRMWKDGFLPRSYHIYDFESYGSDAYLSDLQEEFGSHINKPSKDYLDDKQKFYELLKDRGFDENLPARYGVLSDGVLIGSGSDIVNLLDAERTLVVKGQTGEGGKRVHICRTNDGTFYVDDERHSESSFRDRISEFDGYGVTEYCSNADYLKSIYPDTANTIRIVTMNLPNDDPFIAGTSHRIGTRTSFPVDNFDRGGIAAEITGDGKLGPAARYIDGNVSWHEEHPDTGSRIAGTVVPGWKQIQRTVLSAASAIPELKYIGWDILVTENGKIKIIEGNSNTGTTILQAHNPLLCDERVRRFYHEHGIL